MLPDVLFSTARFVFQAAIASRPRNSRSTSLRVLQSSNVVSLGWYVGEVVKVLVESTAMSQ